MNVVIPMYRVGQNVGGFILTEEAIISLMDRFMSVQKKVPCLDSKKKEIGQLTFIDFKQGVVYFHIDLDKQYSQVRSRIKTFCEVEELHVL